MVDREKISGPIYARKDNYYKEGESYLIVSPNGQGWGLPVDHISPEDLRNLANRLEEKRKG